MPSRAQVIIGCCGSAGRGVAVWCWSGLGADEAVSSGGSG
jgi:hypothetical protein